MYIILSFFDQYLYIYIFRSYNQHKIIKAMIFNFMFKFQIGQYLLDLGITRDT